MIALWLGWKVLIAWVAVSGGLLGLWIALVYTGRHLETRRRQRALRRHQRARRGDIVAHLNRERL